MYNNNNYYWYSCCRENNCCCTVVCCYCCFCCWQSNCKAPQEALKLNEVQIAKKKLKEKKFVYKIKIKHLWKHTSRNFNIPTPLFLAPLSLYFMFNFLLAVNTVWDLLAVLSLWLCSALMFINLKAVITLASDPLVITCDADRISALTTTTTTFSSKYKYRVMLTVSDIC